MWFEIVSEAPAALETDNGQWFTASTAPPMKPRFVQKVFYVPSTQTYYVNVDPGWLSGLRKAGLDQDQAFAKAGFTDAKAA